MAKKSKKSSTKKSSTKKSSTKKPARRKTAARSARRSSPRKPRAKHVPTQSLYGWITHTDFSSRDPVATRAWCADVLGWDFRPSFTMPDGAEYHLFAYSAQGGGGIRPVADWDSPASLPYVHVADAAAAFAKAIEAGAEQVMAPTRVMEGVTLAIVRAPGGVTIGFSGP